MGSYQHTDYLRSKYFLVFYQFVFTTGRNIVFVLYIPYHTNSFFLCCKAFALRCKAVWRRMRIALGRSSFNPSSGASATALQPASQLSEETLIDAGKGSPSGHPLTYLKRKRKK